MTLRGTACAVKKRACVSPRTLAFCYMSIFITVLFFRNAQAASVWVTEGLELCVTKLIPSLFPFMVVSALLIKSGAGRTVFSMLSRPMRALFGIGADSSCALALGWLCGFPVGAKCACELYENGYISKEEYSALLCISGTPSPAFLIGSVGAGMLGSRGLGALLYAVSLASAVIVGVFLKIKIKKYPSPPVGVSSIRSDMPFFQALTRSVSESAVGMLNVCAFVVFFSAFLGALECSLAFLNLSETVYSLVFCFFELTSGLARVCAVNSSYAFPLCALAVGWSGLSVHFQTMSIGLSENVRFSPYVLSHAVRAAICVVIALLI